MEPARDQRHWGIEPFLTVVAARNSVEDPLTDEEFDQASQGPDHAQRSLVNAIGRSPGKDLGALDDWMGGAAFPHLTRPRPAQAKRARSPRRVGSSPRWVSGSV